jgi:hypothetical protein
MIQNWPFSKKILVTAYDIYRNDSFVQYLNRTGQTLRQYLIEDVGLRSDIEIVADTGIFEIESKKARLDFASHFDILPDLSVTDILRAYDIIDPDVVVAPDEMILIEDDKEERERKKEVIKSNLITTLDNFPRKKVMATLQGIETDDIFDLASFIVDQDIEMVARGGLIPLRKSNRDRYYKVLRKSETLLRNMKRSHLHAFGLHSVSALGDYFVANSYNSLDTSAIYWITATRKFITWKGDQIAVRKAADIFYRCGCMGCQLMDQTKGGAPYGSGTFMTALYYHNCHQFTVIVDRILNNAEFAQKFFPYHLTRREPTGKITQKVSYIQQEMPLFLSAGELDTARRVSGSNSPIHTKRIKKSVVDRPRKILILNHCSNQKTRAVPSYLRVTPDTLHKLEQYHMDQKHHHLKRSASAMYAGSQNDIIRKAIRRIRRNYGQLREYPVQVDYYFISAGYGLIAEDEHILPYDITFANKPPEIVDRMVEITGIKDDLRNLILMGRYDTVISTLGNTYQEIVQPVLKTPAVRELVWFSTREREDEHWEIYCFDEFERFIKEGKIGRQLGHMWNKRGNIIANYVQYLVDHGSRSFFDFWHNQFDCLCDTSHSEDIIE